MRQNARAVCAAIATLALCASPSAAEEGMWTFDNFPSERMTRELGWAPDQAWLDRVMAATARLPGCSASNVSGEGLVLTNHHCVLSCVAALSSAGADYVEQGFMARARAEERRCPNLAVSVLVAVSDVTARIDAAAASATTEHFARARNAEIANIEAGCSHGPIRCEVVTLYQGGRYGLYVYRRYEDVRLVFAPEHAMAAFGGDADNFNFPRYCVDFAFLRLYEDGAPAATPNHLAMRYSPVAEGEIVVSAGNPGATSRLRTSAELAFERDVNLPLRLSLLAEQHARLSAYAQSGPEQERLASGALQSVENSLKAISGRRQALADPQGLTRVAAREADLQTRVRRNQASQREVGDAWGEIARAQAAYRSFHARHQLLEASAAQRSDLFFWARDVVRGGAEREKPDAERMARYSEVRLAAVANTLLAPRPVEPSFEALNLSSWLSSLQAHLTLDDPVVRRVLGGESPEALALRLAQSRLADRAYRLQLWEGGADAIAASDDPMIVFVRAWDQDARAVRARYQVEVEAPVARAQERIARARFRAFGETLYPEPTFSPRLSYGRVIGWSEASGAVAPFTRVSGLYARASGAAPFALTQRWLDARSRLDPETQFNLASSNDAISGNSGSALLDREGRIVGALFDGNVHSLGGDYFYDGERNRAVTVSATIMRAALRDVYGMEALVAELEGGASVANPPLGE